jgi:hypothetical protein
VLGGVFYANASSDYSTWQSLNRRIGVCSQPPATPDCTSLANAYHSQADNQTLGTTFVAIGSTMLVAGVATWYLWPVVSPKSNRLTPLVSVR